MRPTPAAVARLAFLCGTLAIAVACNGKNSVAPTPTPTYPVAQSVTVSGTLSLHQPGDTGQLAAIATLSDGTTRNVTALALWSGGTRPNDNARVVSVNQAGLLTAVDFGQTTIGVSYGSTGATVPVRVAPDGAFLVEGMVTDAGHKVDRAKVEATSTLGAYSTTTDTSGVFVLPGAGVVTIQASKYGYNAAVRQVMVQRDEQLTLELAQLAQPGSIVGHYTLTFIASPSCTLPAEASRRTYGALIGEARTYHALWDLDVSLDGATFVDDSGWGLDPGFAGTVDGNTVRFTITNGEGGPAVVFIERIGDMTMRYLGEATGTVSGNRIATTFNGTVEMRAVGSSTIAAQCRAADHQLVFVR